MPGARNDKRTMSDNKGNILLVEDDQNLGFVVQDALKRKGYTVHLCRDGKEGLKYFNEHAYDICVLDVMLPQKDGFSLAEDIRLTDQKIPIVFLTAKGRAEEPSETRPAARISATQGAELPSRIGTSGPSTSTVRLSSPRPTAADRRCSTVPMSRPRSPSEVAKSSRPASSATAGIETPTSVRTKTTPRPAGAGRRVARTAWPEWRPTPATETVRARVVCSLITLISTHVRCQPDLP